MKRHIIIMADVVRSRKMDQDILHDSLNDCISEVNQIFKREIQSPLTITLGDEFQGIVKSAEAACRILFHIDEYTRNQELAYELRFAINYGVVETKVNPKSAHNMLGKGLTQTRELLEGMSRKQRDRFRIRVADERLDTSMENILNVYDGIVNSWNLKKDKETIKTLIKYPKDDEAANVLNKTRQQIWKRRATLLIDEYVACKETIVLLSQMHHD